MNQDIKPLHKQISYSISKSPYTVNLFAQQMNMKLKLLEAFIDGTAIPEKKVICKMNRFLNPKIVLF